MSEPVWATGPVVRLEDAGDVVSAVRVDDEGDTDSDCDCTGSVDAGGVVDPVDGGVLDPVDGGVLDPVDGGVLDPVDGGVVDPVDGGVDCGVDGGLVDLVGVDDVCVDDVCDDAGALGVLEYAVFAGAPDLCAKGSAALDDVETRTSPIPATSMVRIATNTDMP